ncbi:anthranilate isomerase [Sistotremastrum suecicum HHB10207 ss-3]|uniref:Multifunctional tryptophan biosynthesis protein n=1 Tax=Sistotremastrum suecicum HHB10207 ss-3 TaxID=1314776 RepID=A0A166GUA4_9AGAM|nr:anthranilate isomerase [Sistotremastrum suecicum HHB10207 ss-3]
MSLPPALTKEIQLLLIDNFDSFTWNLYQSFCLLGADVTVIRNNAITADQLPLLKIKSLCISPGPGHPKTDSGISRDAIKYFAGKIPILGVCMGLECMVDIFGGDIEYAGEIMHGKTSKVRHDGRGCMQGIPQNFVSTRYHSLATEIKSLPPDLQITATTQESGVVMGVRHRTYAIESVQYHPESILSEQGDALLQNFLSLNGATWGENPHVKVDDISLPPFKLDAPESLASRLPTILEKIHTQRIKDVEVARTTPGTTPADLQTLLSLNIAPPLTSFVSRLRNGTHPALMAEIKRASPSKGDISITANAAQQALTYALGGASVISVLTEPTWFKGSLLDMRLARQAVDSLPNRPAILRKDFILDEYQISEARLHGADTVLLIVAMLPLPRLKSLYTFSLSLGMEPLVEVNNAAEMHAALDLGAKVIGVNNRNLHDFQVDMGTTSRLVEMVRERDVILCALSGITRAEDVRDYVQQGVGAVLVGESLMRASDPAAFIRELLGLGPPPVVPSKPTPLVKICGLKTTGEALAAAKAGPDLIGLVFAPRSKRFVNLETASSIAAAIHELRTTPVPFEPPVGNIENQSWFATQAHALEKAVGTHKPLIVGVFQGQSLEEIQHIVHSVPLDIVQLHGSEPLEWSKFISVPVIRAFHVGAGVQLQEITRSGLHKFLLLDSIRKGDPQGLSGGSGTVVDWDLAKTIVDRGEASRREGSTPLPIILAGGLTPENVAEAVATVQPWAVDVSGGVEKDDGDGKDIEKIFRFIAAAKGLESQC